MNQRPKLGSEGRGAKVRFWVRAALSKRCCLGTLNIPITPSCFRNFGKEQLKTDSGKTGFMASFGMMPRTRSQYGFLFEKERGDRNPQYRRQLRHVFLAACRPLARKLPFSKGVQNATHEFFYRDHFRYMPSSNIRFCHTNDRPKNRCTPLRTTCWPMENDNSRNSS